MPLSVVDLYRDILPKTNCGDCGFPACLAFASIVVSEKLPLGNCPHIESGVIESCQKELDEQYASGKWLKRDMAQDALEWAKQRFASMKIEDLPDRIGGKLIKKGDGVALELPYFTDSIIVTKQGILKKNGSDLTRWEQVFIHNHMAQGGSKHPSGKWKGLVEFPNTVSKIKSMVEHVEAPLKERFTGKPDELLAAAGQLGGLDMTNVIKSADLALLFRPLPRIPVMLMFWDEDKIDGFETEIKLLFDETITDHLDIESIMFLSERLGQLLCEAVIP
ncbi:MAG: DUF3786 domain-containing protein [Deltaproteobacteria bacterium]|nr:DUF3786 domain-containing protein [Deltaproteobacteria bacterium]MBW2090353.1 DUF3786 domain-containing protein [Deltaproteobacteria bacterium]